MYYILLNIVELYIWILYKNRFKNHIYLLKSNKYLAKLTE